MIQLLLFYIFVSHLYFGATIFLWTYKLQSCTVCHCHAPLAFYFSRFSFYVAISSVVILIFLFFCERPFARTISNRWPDHSLSFHYLYKYIYKNTADDISALWTCHRRYRFILWVFLCGSGISVSSVRIRLHCKHGSIQPDAILSRTLKGFHGHRRKFLIQS